MHEHVWEKISELFAKRCVQSKCQDLFLPWLGSLAGDGRCCYHFVCVANVLSESTGARFPRCRAWASSLMQMETSSWASGGQTTCGACALASPCKPLQALASSSICWCLVTHKTRLEPLAMIPSKTARWLLFIVQVGLLNLCIPARHPAPTVAPKSHKTCPQEKCRRRLRPGCLNRQL